MKVYRVIPDSFVSNKKLDQKSFQGLEGIYYQASYSSFVGKMGYHDYNNLATNIKNEGKYFFLFAEDAIQEASALIRNYHRINMDTCLVIEYDIPEEVILKVLGYGDYTEGISSLYLIESYVYKNDFGDVTLTTDDLSADEKLKILIEALNESLKRILECHSILDKMAYVSYFHGRKLEAIINNKQEIATVLINSPFYDYFIREKRQLVKSPYITGKVVPVNQTFWEKKQYDTYSKIGEYYQSLGIDCDFTKEHKEVKKEILYYLQQGNPEKEKVRTLLRQIKH